MKVAGWIVASALLLLWLDVRWYWFVIVALVWVIVGMLASFAGWGS